MSQSRDSDTIAFTMLECTLLMIRTQCMLHSRVRLSGPFRRAVRKNGGSVRLLLGRYFWRQMDGLRLSIDSRTNEFCRPTVGLPGLDEEAPLLSDPCSHIQDLVSSISDKIELDEAFYEHFKNRRVFHAQLLNQKDHNESTGIDVNGGSSDPLMASYYIEYYEEHSNTPKYYPLKQAPKQCAMVTYISYIFLFIAMLAIASGGVAFKKLPPDVINSPLLACLWRNEATLLVIILPAIYQVVRMENRRDLLDTRLWLYIFLGGISVAAWSGTFAVALKYTSLTRVYLLNNCQPLIIVIWDSIRRKPTNRYHYLGVFFGIIGLLFACYTEDCLDMDMEELIGDAIAFSGAIFAAIYISIGSRIRDKAPSFVYLLPTTVMCMLLYGAATIILEGTSYDMFIVWYKPEYLPVVGWLAGVTGLLGTAVIAAVMKYIPAIAISIVLLAEPITASVIAIVMKVENPPLWVNWVGAGMVLIGIGLVMKGCSMHKQKMSH
ncbi:Drug/Metabolite Transporter (DMT) Superfamily [Planoprotostelium fungivorum]|uniref:Drug/Metabolite Transporter (DMT) Superfamily n=1 Tax=Planoprotostelium fungivorum TaxID=1890364 RepID=A0A2P6P0K5_9EUKA|nr:Drug/Metabolite Transporter (DMT) Superfamily [Planoprotostelium fungivorum]